MALGSLPALGVQTPQINTLGNFQAAQANAQEAKSQALEQKRKSMEGIYMMSAGLLRDGKVDPNEWESAISMMEQGGADPDFVKTLRGKPELAEILAQGSASALKFSQDERAMDIELQKLAQKVEEAANRSLTITYGEDASGNVVPLQAGNDGTLVKSAVPEGVSVLPPYELAKEKAKGTAVGKGEGEREIAAPAAVAGAEQTLAQIDDVMNDPNLGWAVGLGGVVPAIANTAQAGVIAKIEQLQGRAFLEAFQSLKGGGQITEVEGKKATDAIARLQRTQNLEDFKAALKDLRDVVAAGLERARASGGVATPASDDEWDPAKMTDDDLLTMLGAD